MKEHTYNSILVNILAIILMIPIVYIMISLFKHYGTATDILYINAFIENLTEKSLSFIILFLISILLGIVIHELLHGIIFSLYAENGFKDVKFGFNLKAFAPYAHCKVPLKRNQYILAVIMPGLVLGVLPSIIFLVNGNIIWFSWSLLFIVTAIGDLMIFFKLLFINKTLKVKDHPTKVGFYTFESI